MELESLENGIGNIRKWILKQIKWNWYYLEIEFETLKDGVKSLENGREIPSHIRHYILVILDIRI